MSNYGKEPSKGITVSSTGVQIAGSTKTDVVALGVTGIVAVGVACIGGIIKLVSSLSK